MSSGAHKISVALDVCVARDAAQCLADATRSGFDFIALPLFHPRYTRDGLPHVSAARTGPGTRTDTTLTAEEWASCVVGKVSPWIDLDHACASIVTASEKGLKTELAWASHLGVPAVMLPALRHGDNANLARHVNQVVQSSCGMHFWVTLPLVDASVRVLPPTGALASITECAAGAVTDTDDVYLPAAGPAESGAPEEVDALQLRLRFQSTPLETESLGTTTTAGATAAVAAAPVSDAGAGSTSDELAPANDPWQWWATFRALCEHHPNVSCALELSAELPSQRHLHRWLCEPIKAAIIPTSLFVMNAAGYPVLSRRHQYFIQSLLSHKVQFLLRGRPDPSFMTPGTDACGGLQRYVEYITHILRKVPTLTEQEQFEAPFLDYLQAPLQPLMDNLESQTYEVFERDPIKYQQYELAIQRALEDTPVDKVSVLMIVGAGRGPIVKRALTAAELAGRTVRVYAIEKNPNAIITLRSLQRSEWKDRVQVVATDMRVWNAPEQADILISELLGSFGDNELSPECLDGAQRFLKEGGVSIPAAYTSFLSPLMSSKLWNEVKALKEPKWFETPFVVNMRKVVELASPQPAFTFVHPNRASAIDNNRATTLRFSVTEAGVLHGLAGYFDSTLYKDVHISIHPATHSRGMFSWFPIYFPVREPVRVCAGDVIEVRMWRCVSDRKVWYEWAVTSPVVSPIHNPGGRSYWIGL